MSAGGRVCRPRLQEPEETGQQPAKCNARTLFDPVMEIGHRENTEECWRSVGKGPEDGTGSPHVCLGAELGRKLSLSSEGPCGHMEGCGTTMPPASKHKGCPRGGLTFRERWSRVQSANTGESALVSTVLFHFEPWAWKIFK